MDGGAWKAAVHGVAEGRTRLRDFTFTFHFHALEEEMATHSSILAWRIPWSEGPWRTPWGRKESDETERLTHTQKDVLFSIGNWNAKVRSQETPGVTRKFDFGVQNEARQRLIEFCQENTLVIVNIHGQFQNQIDYIL